MNKMNTDKNTNTKHHKYKPSAVKFIFFNPFALDPHAAMGTKQIRRMHKAQNRDKTNTRDARAPNDRDVANH